MGMETFYINVHSSNGFSQLNSYSKYMTETDSIILNHFFDNDWDIVLCSPMACFLVACETMYNCCKRFEDAFGSLNIFTLETTFCFDGLSQSDFVKHMYDLWQLALHCSYDTWGTFVLPMENFMKTRSHLMRKKLFIRLPMSEEDQNKLKEL